MDEAVAANNSNTHSLYKVIENTLNRNSSPIAYPFLLYIVQKIQVSAFSVRFPSALAGTLAVLGLLLLPIVNVSKTVSFIAAFLATFSLSQLRYAQETREYSISVLMTVLMIWAVLGYLKNERKSKYNFLLCAGLIALPQVQYGLVLFGIAILSTYSCSDTGDIYGHDFTPLRRVQGKISRSHPQM